MGTKFQHRPVTVPGVGLVLPVLGNHCKGCVLCGNSEGFAGGPQCFEKIRPELGITHRVGCASDPPIRWAHDTPENRALYVEYVMEASSV